MIGVVKNTWALLIGIMLLMLGNGVQGTLLGVRGGLEGFSPTAMSIVMSGYFAGFLFGSQYVPELIRRVGHVRVFAALGSFISAALILFPVFTDPIAWTVLRVILGFCFCGVYITSESWLNNATSNDTRGQALSAYMIVQMVGIIAAQAIFGFGDPSGWELFIIPSVLVSLAFAPILLTISPVPPFEQTEPMSFREIYQVSPLGCVGIFLMGGIFSAMFGMAAVYGSEAGLSNSQIALFVGAIYMGGLAFQFPIGWLSDNMDRRRLIFFTAILGVCSALPVLMNIGGFYGVLVSGALIGGMANPLYSLLLAYTNDYLDSEDMASASARLLFINGVGAIAGPLITGWLMTSLGPNGFFLFISVLFGSLAVYALYRMTQRSTDEQPEGDLASMGFSPVTAVVTPVAIEARAEEWVEQAAELEEEATP